MNRSRSGYIFIVLCAVIFSTMEVMLKTVHGVFAPMQITCLRFLVGGVLLIPFAMRSIRKKNAVLTRKDLGFFACAGFLCVVIAMSLYQMSVTYTRASIVAVIFSCNPISASRAWFFAFSTSCGIFATFRRRERTSDVSTVIVPSSTG